MKKILLLVAVATLATGAFAQGKGIEWGVKAGLNLSSLSNSDLSGSIPIEDVGNITVDASSKMKPSFYVGFFVDFPISDFFSIQPELLYSRQGSFYKTNVSVGGMSGDMKLWMRYDYLNIPILAKLYVAEKLSIDVGPQFGIMVYHGVKAKIEDSSSTKKGDTGDYNTFDVSAALGLTYKVCRNIDISARYTLGFTDIFKDNSGGDKVKNGVIQIGAGYCF